MGKWRATVLVVVHLAIVAHAVQWLVSGMRDGVRNTLSPVEPSEAMHALEGGRINAGFVMFILAIITTALFGRFFCGWLCHIVALQDLCGWMMKKIGIHPKPWRSRLLLWVPLAVAVYMFIWPTFRREVVVRAFAALGGTMPAWMGEVQPLRGFTNQFMVEDFWASFPPYYIAIPMLLIIGFGMVYFLGAKAFCTYGCPYGGFFGPVDRLAPVRIKVSDACNGCGHCTAVCTSNVRVSEEVRDYGAVVDPGCMKCLDCVSVCPNGALSVGFATPAIFTKPRNVESAKLAAKKRSLRYDLTLREELVAGVIFYLLVFGYRGMYGQVPLLLAVAMAGLGTFAIHSTWRLMRDANVRGPFWQLKRGGRVTAAGGAFALFTAAFTAVGLQGVVMNYASLRGDLIYAQLEVSRSMVFAPGYAPRAGDQAAAERALSWYNVQRSIRDGGIAFYTSWGVDVRMSWLAAVAGDLPASERYLRGAIDGGLVNDDLALGLVQVRRLRCASAEQIDQEFARLLKPSGDLTATRVAYRDFLISFGRVDEAKAVHQRAIAHDPASVDEVNAAASWLMSTRQFEPAASVLQAGLTQRPTSPVLRSTLARVRVAEGKLDEAIELQRLASDSHPSPERYALLADLLAAKRDFAGAEAVLRKSLDDFQPSGPVVIRLAYTLAARQQPPSAIADEIIALSNQRLRDEALRHAVAVHLRAMNMGPRADELYTNAMAELTTTAPVETVQNAAELRLVTGHAPEAVAMLTALVSRHPQSDKAYATLALAQFVEAQGAGPQYDAAMASFAKARELASDVDPMGKLAGNLANNQRFEDLVGLYERAMADSPRHIPTLFNAAGAYFTIQQPQRALDLMQRALAIPGAGCDPKLLDYAGRAMFLMGKDSESLPYLKEACDRQPTPERLDNLAEVYGRLGLTAEAEMARAQSVASRSAMAQTPNP